MQIFGLLQRDLLIHVLTSTGVHAPRHRRHSEFPFQHGRMNIGLLADRLIEIGILGERCIRVRNIVDVIIKESLQCGDAPAGKPLGDGAVEVAHETVGGNVPHITAAHHH